MNKPPTPKPALPCHICDRPTRGRLSATIPDSKPLNEQDSIPICNEDRDNWTFAIKSSPKQTNPNR